jgi:hypothetical protein
VARRLRKVVSPHDLMRYALSGENQSAGSVMRHQLAPYCNEQRFIFERWRNH